MNGFYGLAFEYSSHAIIALKCIQFIDLAFIQSMNWVQHD